MVKIIISLLILASTFFASEVELTDYKQGLLMAQKENKLVAVTIVQTSCPWCVRFKKETLPNPEISKTLKQNFVHIFLNKDTQEIPQHLKARLVPTTFFLNKNGEKISAQATGYFGPEDFTDFLNDALKKGKK